MAIHTQLPIYKVTYDLLDVVTDFAKNMPRDFKRSIEYHLDIALDVHLNPAKTILQPIDRGIDFVGQVIKPWRRVLRRRTLNDAISRAGQIPAEELFEPANSYFGLLRQATHSHTDRACLANVLRKRGHTIKTDLTKTYRRAA